MMRRYLVAYDYGQGGIWGFIVADSAEEIERQYPKLTVVKNAPEWLSGDRLQRLEQTKTFDLNDRAGLWKAGLIDEQ